MFSFGIAVVVLIFLGVLALSIIIERVINLFRNASIPKDIHDALESYDFDLNSFSKLLESKPTSNVYVKFFKSILKASNKTKDTPIWWIESIAQDEAMHISSELSRGMWLLDTSITAAPLIGLLGTVVGMIKAFGIIGMSGIVAPKEVTGGVAEALFSTAMGLLVAIVALFGYNYLSKSIAFTLDELERLGTKLVAHIKMIKGEV
ncbi:MotA/TolQ/ExbB proton channel family protein [Hydrogenobaculum sp.]|nr:MAG: MotA/TolQ/ExbB proton channel family protein [Hydrogenobaculum sp.]